MILWAMRYRQGIGEVDEDELGKLSDIFPDTDAARITAEMRVLKHLHEEYGVISDHIEDITSVWNEGGIWNVTVVLFPRLRGEKKKARKKEQDGQEI